jgi:hypothetical protein
LENLSYPMVSSSGALASTLGMMFPSRIDPEEWNGFYLVKRVALSTDRRTHRGYFTRASVEKALGKMRTKDNFMRAAVAEVVHRRQSPTKVAKFYGIPLDKLNVYAARLRGRIRASVEVAA